MRSYRVAAKLILCMISSMMLAILSLPLMTFGDAAQNSDGGIGGDRVRGAELIKQSGCGACHLIPGIMGAKGRVGPSLSQVAERVYIAGVLRNTPDNMVAWLRHPQSIVPNNAMPEMGLTELQARDIASYLYTLR